jgi:hypothetical protein
MSFFGNLNNPLRALLRHIQIRTYVKKDARNALTFLAEAKGLEHLRLEIDVVKDDDPIHAAGLFWPDVCKLLEAVGSRIEKSMVPPRKVLPQEPDTKEEESSQEDESESDSESEEEDEGEGEDEDEGEDNETEESDESTRSDEAEAKDSKDDATANSTETKDVNGDVAMSDEPKDAEDVKVDNTESGDHKPADVQIEEAHADATEPTSEPSKKDSKSPTPAVPAAPIKKKAVQPEPPQLIQGKKCFAVDILNFSKASLKDKNGSP